MKHEILVNIERSAKRENFSYGVFDVSIWYYGGMFRIELVGGWDYDNQVPEYGFGTGFSGDFYRSGFNTAVNVALNDIRSKCNDHKVKNDAESALARACVEFRMKHGMLL